MKNLNSQLADKTIGRALQLNRYAAGAGRDIARIIRLLEATILKGMGDIPTEVARLRKYIKEVQGLIRDTYSEILGKHTKELTEIAQIEAQWQYDTINKLVVIEIMKAQPPEAVLDALARNTLIVGNTASQWWSQQSDKLQNEFRRIVQSGIAQSQTNQQMATAFRKATGTAQRNAYALVKTGTQSVAIAAREATMQANESVVKGKQSLATLDSHTSAVCRAYDHAKYDLENKPIMGTKLPYLAIPRHFGCRSVWLSILKSWQEMGLPFDELPSSTRASMDGQVSAELTFSDFLAGKSKQWQDDYLGPGRAELWRDGKITLADMVDGTGRELSLKQLKELH